MLTPKQERFVLVYLECGNASEGYRRAYDASRMKPESIHRCAKDLLVNPKIASRIEELRRPAAEEARVTLAQHLADLKTIRDAALEAGAYGAAAQAEHHRGRAAGLYVDRRSLSVGLRPLEEMSEQELLILLGGDPAEATKTIDVSGSVVAPQLLLEAPNRRPSRSR
jgi:hypothetical protein